MMALQRGPRRKIPTFLGLEVSLHSQVLLFTGFSSEQCRGLRFVSLGCAEAS